MRGYIRRTGKGSWQIQIYTDVDSNGQRHRYFETVHGRKSIEAQKRLNELLVNLEKGICIPPGKLTVEEHLTQWLESYVRTNCSQRTYDGYKSIVDCHLLPALGQVQLKYLQAPTIQSYYAKACETLSARTVAKHHRLLSQALKYAVRQGYLGRNPCDLVDAPSWRGRAMRTLTPGEVDTLFDALKDNAIYPATYTAISTGLRQAELLGLRWRDLDLELCSISVSRVLYKRRGVCEFKEPKTTYSRRRVAMTPKLALFLKQHKADSESLHWQLGKPLTLDSLIFSNIEGEPLDPSMLSHEFAKVAKMAGLPGVRFHDLRHTFASLMLLRGAKPKVISEALGHASVAFTLQTYSHIISGMQEEAMALLDDVLPRGINANLTLTATKISVNN